MGKKNVQDGLGVQNITDLVLKEIYCIYKTINHTKDQIKKYKITEREIFEKQQRSLCQKWCYNYCY